MAHCGWVPFFLTMTEVSSHGHQLQSKPNYEQQRKAVVDSFDTDSRAFIERVRVIPIHMCPVDMAIKIISARATQRQLQLNAISVNCSDRGNSELAVISAWIISSMTSGPPSTDASVMMPLGPPIRLRTWCCDGTLMNDDTRVCQRSQGPSMVFTTKLAFALLN